MPMSCDDYADVTTGDMLYERRINSQYGAAIR